MSEPRRAIPSVERLLQALDERELPRGVVLRAIREELGARRAARAPSQQDEILGSIRAGLDEKRLARLRPVINGSGIVAHTNLGRAPLADAAVDRIAEIARGYCNLEMDLAGGERGSRGQYVEELLSHACEAEAATVVNNCAAALVLILRHFTKERREVVISRGELVQIGGGFRIPEILEASGAVLREVGTTNRTTVKDYERAIGAQTGLVLKVHQSNFHMEGFVESAGAGELAELARARGIALAHDLGSGALRDTAEIEGLGHEPTPGEALQHGADLVCFSGDKLMGGPQAGVIAGSRTHIAALKKEPFFRALRCDKLVFAALEATLEIYLKRGPGIPLWEMMEADVGSLRDRAVRIERGLADVSLRVTICEAESQVGGGSLPRSAIPSVALVIASDMKTEAFAERLRRGKPPVVGRIVDDALRLDLRTVFPQQDDALLAALRAASRPV